MAGRILRTAVLVLIWLVSGVTAASAEGGPWSWPLAGPHEVSRPFDPPASRYGTGHRGVDLPGVAGQDVLAAGAGHVSYAGLIAGRGVVVVAHGELRTTYEPVTGAVTVDDLVEAGQPIGTLEDGHLGCPFDACLHWGLKRGEDYLDPVGLVERGPARLLPVGAGRSGGQVAHLPLPNEHRQAALGRDKAGPVGTDRAGGAEPAEALGSTGPLPPHDPGGAEIPEPGGGWSSARDLRTAGEATTAAVLLVAGIGLLRPRRPAPPEPGLDPGAAAASGGAADHEPPRSRAILLPPDAPPDPPDPPVAPVVDLSVARERRSAEPSPRSAGLPRAPGQG